MKKMINIALLLMMLCAAASLAAEYSDEFLLGPFTSKLRIPKLGDPDNQTDMNIALANLLEQAGFNSVRATAVFNPDSTAVVDFASTLDADSLDLILEDLIFVPEDQYGYSALSTGVHLKFEAEYSSADAVNDDQNNDRYFYKSIGRKGEFLQNLYYSNDYYWSVPSDTVGGYAYKDLLYRWPTGNGEYYRVGPEFRFLRSRRFCGNPIETDDNCLYVKFVFKADGLDDLDDDDVLATFSFTCYKNSRDTEDPDEDYPNPIYRDNDQSDPLFVSFLYGDDPDPMGAKSLTKAEYELLPQAAEHGDPDVKEICFSFPLELQGEHSLLGQGVVKATAWYWQLKNLNPRMWWHGRGSLMLDYVEFSDKVYNEFTTDPNELARLRDFDQVFDQIPNLSHHFGIDEPKHPHFQAMRILEDHLRAMGGKELLTASSFEKRNVIKPDGTPLRLTQAYIEEVNPRALMINRYLSQPGENIWWNWGNVGNLDDLGFVQMRIEKNVLDEYNRYRNEAFDRSMKFIVMPQIYGEWNTEENKWNFILPPGKFAKCLQLLPLCYKPDGIVPFKFDAKDDNQYAMVKHTQSGIEIEPLIYNDVRDANHKIEVYGPMIRNNNWSWEDVRTIKGINNNSPLPDSYLLDSMEVQYPADADTSSGSESFYYGFIQSALYLEDQQYPWYMLVNRRAVKQEGNGGGWNVPYSSYVEEYDIPDPQTVELIPNANAQNIYGNYIALYDPYDGSLFKELDSHIDVPIDPGDGKLLQMCSTLPSIVDSTQTLRHMVYLSDEITLADSAQVSISAGTETHVLSNTNIHIPAGCEFTFKGNVDFGDSVFIYVEPGGSLYFEDAVCSWGENSTIEVENGNLFVNGGNWNKSINAASWAGIRASDSSDITLNGLVISDARYNSVNNSDLYVTNCRFEIPSNGFGLLISNTTEGYTTRITNNESGTGFFGNSYQDSRGIVLGCTKNTVILDSLYFNNLMTGIWKSSNVSVRDSIIDCTFSNCNTGINIISRDYVGLIESCGFNLAAIDSTAAGIRLIAANPRISECDFHTHRGILTEYSIDTFSRDSGVFDCDFNECDIGIESRGSNHRMERNYFNFPDYGIVCHAKSNLNLQDGANNVLQSYISNIKFFDEQPYEAWIQLYKGNNDFYHLDQGDGKPAIDFEFDPRYFGYPLPLDNKINASGNWFQDMLVTVNDTLYVDYVYVDEYDPEPNMPAILPENRFFTALGLESQGQYDEALDLYKAILNNPLESELRHLASAADGVYRLKELVNDPTWDPTVYFDAKALQYETEDPNLSGLLEEYLAKSFIVSGDYQSAIDLIQIRLDYPTSEVDSLLAVLDLEIVLQLAALEDDKKPLTTKYTQYKYPDIKTFTVNHETHWNQLRNLRYGNPEAITVPSVPVISRNYPNPFNPSTTIDFSVPQKSRVKLNVYNIRGQKVKNLINSELERGHHKIVWDGRDGTNRKVSSGIYFIRLESGGKTNTRKIMLMK